VPKHLHRPWQWHLLGTQKRTAGQDQWNLQSQRQREERESSLGVSGVAELNRKARPGVTSHKAVSMAKERCRNEEMEREGVVARDC